MIDKNMTRNFGVRGKWSIFLAAGLLGVALTGCSTTRKAPDVAGTIRQDLKAQGLSDVSVSQDRDKGVVTLGGHVASDSDKTRAESIARTQAGNQVVADQIAVLMPGVQSDSKAINSDLDKGIEKNLDAALIQNRMQKQVKYGVKNGVVTLTGDVNSETRRANAQQVASTVPNVVQVVNEIQVKNQKATSSN